MHITQSAHPLLLDLLITITLKPKLLHITPLRSILILSYRPHLDLRNGLSS